ncbi:CD3337/EF1877 family mobilome membrane protein [Tetragenococcus halophilus]|uniref:CD3337/EF1877 family mobilome membrane protein n=1 Tax=Tetragenococcus halophilus TaxID=51669 RepID=UPI0033839E1B|nr:YtxH domain-containing protein [Tetragenococcus halophilus]
MIKKRTKQWLTVGLILLTVFFLFLALGTVAQAAGLVDDTVDSANHYSQYPLRHYQLDFYVDDSWDWLPWNWQDGIGKQVQYALYAIANFIWTISLYIANATGYLVQQAYTLDFISDTAEQIGENMQTLAGVTTSGFAQEGFYVGFLLLFILLVGIYVTYVGLVKKESSKALQAVTNFIGIFLLSAAFIASAPSYIQKINDFSSDISQASLDLGAKIVLPNSESRGNESVDLIRENLFAIQVEQPWLLLQYDQSDKEAIGEDRVDQLVEVDPDENQGEDREAIVKEEIEDQENRNLTLTKTVPRLGTVVFLFFFNIGISIFVFLLTGIMIFSQVLFIVYALFLPLSLLLSSLPTFNHMGKSAIMKLFNTLMLRAGVTLVITIAFSISTMVYTLTSDYPFFLIAFLQIVVFAGIYLRLGDIMSLFNLQSQDSQQISRRVFQQPRRYMNQGARRASRAIRHTVMGGMMGATTTRMAQKQAAPEKTGDRRSSSTTSSEAAGPPPSRSYQTGQTVGRVLDTKNRTTQAIRRKQQQIQELPQQVQRKVVQSKTDFQKGISAEHTKTKRSTTTNKTSETKKRKSTKRTAKRPNVSPSRTRGKSVNPQTTPPKDKRSPSTPKFVGNIQQHSPRYIAPQRPLKKDATQSHSLESSSRQARATKPISTRPLKQRDRVHLKRPKAKERGDHDEKV